MRPVLLFLALAPLVIRAENRIAFRDIPFDSLLRAAAREKKAVFLYFHFTGCGACLQMEKTAMADSTVAVWWNEHFISFEVNTRTDEGRKINAAYGVEMHPTFLFLNPDGRELHKITGVFSPQNFLLQGQQALSSSNTLSAMRARYEAGERDPDFLYTYCYMLRDAWQLTSDVVNAYLAQLSPQQLDEERNIRFIYEFCLHHYKVLIPYGSPAFTHLIQHQDRYVRFFPADQVDTRIVWILSTATWNAIEAQDQERFDELLRALEPYDKGGGHSFRGMDNRITGMTSSGHLVAGARMEFFDRSSDREAYLRARKDYLRLIRKDASELNTYAWGTFERSEDPEKLKMALKCAHRAVRLEYAYAHLDTQAWLLYATGDFKGAIRQGYKAIEQAKKENQDYSETEKLLRMAREKYGKNWSPSNCWC